MSQLRSFAGFGKTAPYYPFVNGVSGAAGAGKLPRHLVNLDGTAAAAGFLQLFDLTSGNPTNGTVPLKSFDVAAAGPLPSLFESLGPIEFLNGICIAMSSTQTTYTAVATAFDAHGEVEEWEGPGTLIPPSTIVAGDLVTGVNLLQVWADGAGPKKLYQVDYINGNAAPVWVEIYAAQVPTGAGDRAIIPARGKITTTTPVTFRFGANGLDIYTKDQNGVIHNGCWIQPSSTAPPTFTPVISADQNIQAYYK